MAASDNLSGQQFFHGTRYSFKPGQIVDPGEAPNSNYGYGSADQHFYMTTDRFLAKHYANESYGPSNRRSLAKPKVYYVEPLGDVEHDEYGSNADHAGEQVSFRTPHKVRILHKIGGV